MSGVPVLTHTLYSIPPSQFNGISANVSAPSIIHGTFHSTYGEDLYGVTPSAFHNAHCN